MSSVLVTSPGLLTTVMDLGRHGHQRHGVAVGGAVDRFAARLANTLVGNDDGAAVMEMTQIGPSIAFDQDALVAWTGADMAARIGNDELPRDRAVRILAGDSLECGRARGGLRAWLAIAGGIEVPRVLGSRSTDTLAKLGGFEGRRLRSGDRLVIGESSHWSEAAMPLPRRASSWFVRPNSFTAAPAPGVVRAIRGPEWDWFTEAAQAAFFSASWRVTKDADRMGLRLEGPALARRETREMISEAMPEGAVQIAADAQPIVLMAARQTIGGYPRIAVVASVDMTVLSQHAPGDLVQFQEVPVAAAQGWLIEREQSLAQLRAGLARLSG